MMFELNGKRYFTEEKTLVYTRIFRINEDGQEMICVFDDLPLHPSLAEVISHVKYLGAKVVSE